MLLSLFCSLFLALHAQADGSDPSYYSPGYMRAEEKPRSSSAKPPEGEEQAILRLQREGDVFSLYRCAARNLSAAAIDESRCEFLGKVDIQKVGALADKLHFDASYSREEWHTLLILGTSSLAVVGAIGSLGTLLSLRYLSGLIRGSVIITGLGASAVASFVVAAYRINGGKLAIDFNRIDAREVLTYLGQVLASKVPEGQEYVQPFSARLWPYFAPESFR